MTDPVKPPSPFTPPASQLSEVEKKILADKAAADTAEKARVEAEAKKHEEEVAKAAEDRKKQEEAETARLAEKAKKDEEARKVEEAKQKEAKVKADKAKADAIELKKKQAIEKDKCLLEAQTILAQHDGLEANIPTNHAYWGLMNRYRAL